MNDDHKTQEELINELNRLRQRLDGAEQSANELRLHSEILQNMSEGVHLIRVSDGLFVFTNSIFEQMFGYESGELIGKHVSIVNAPTEQDPMKTSTEIMQILNKTGIWQGEIHTIRKDGTTFWSLVTVSSFHDNKFGDVWLSVHQNITQHKLIEEQLRKSNRAYKVLSDCNQTLIRATEEIALLNEICRIIVEIGEYRLAWVGFAEHDDAKTVRPVAQAGYEDGYLEMLKITWNDTKRGRGPSGTAIRDGKPIISQDILTDPKFEPWRVNAIQRGFASSIALPIFINNEVVGVVTIYDEEPNAFDASEVELLVELADDLAYGIHGLRTRAAREQAEASLRQRHSELEAILDVAQDILLILEPDGIITDYRVSQESDLFVAPEEFLHKKIQDILPYEISKQFEDTIEMIVTTGAKQTIEYQLKIPTIDKLQWYEVVLSPNKQQIIGVIRNITKRKQAEARRDGLAQIVENSLNEIYIFDAETLQFIEANRGARDNLRYTLDELSQMTPIDIKPEYTREAFVNLVQPLHAGEQETIEFTTVHQRKDGSHYPVNVYLQLTTYQSSKVFVAIILDITEQKQAKALALENEHLKTQFQKEQEQTALIQHIISTLSHDIRTPLSVISMSRDMLANYFGMLTEEKRYEKLNTIEHQIQFALQLLDDTVQMARGRQEFHPALVNLATLCQISVDEIHLAKNINHQLRFDNIGEVETVFIDETLVSRILLNLLSNAMKYSPNGGEIRLELNRHEDWIILRVIDHGLGIRDDDLPHIFDLLYRADNAQGIHGTGLGLSIVKDCVERHQGIITVQSELDKGSTFTVKLPV